MKLSPLYQMPAVSLSHCDNQIQANKQNTILQISDVPLGSNTAPLRSTGLPPRGQRAGEGQQPHNFELVKQIY